MKQIILAVVTLTTGLFLSAVAAWYSIIGLTAIFPGAYESIVIMGAGLEVAKLAAVSWLYHNWYVAPKLVRFPMTFSVVILMLLTSMGIYGFLSKAHIEQTLKINTGVVDKIASLDIKLKIKQDQLNQLDSQSGNVDKAVEKLIEMGRVSQSLKVNKTEQVNIEKAKIVDEMIPLKEEKIKLESELKKIEAEVGPIKYVAELFAEKTDQKTLDKAVRGVIILLIFVFDPLAILLLLAFNISIQNRVRYGLEFVNIDNDKLLKKKRTRHRRRKPVVKETSDVT